MPTSTGGDDPGEIHYQMWSTKCGTNTTTQTQKPQIHPISQIQQKRIKYKRKYIL
jgi:hypothetical protein